jgi:hypothetical protein
MHCASETFTATIRSEFEKWLDVKLLNKIAPNNWHCQLLELKHQATYSETFIIMFWGVFDVTN